MYKLFILIAIISLFSCKKNATQQPVVVIKADTTYSYSQSISNLGIEFEKKYTLKYMEDTPGGHVAQRDTIVFHADSSITENMWMEGGGGIYSENTQTHNITMYFDTLNNYYIHDKEPYVLATANKVGSLTLLHTLFDGKQFYPNNALLLLKKSNNIVVGTLPTKMLYLSFSL